MAGETGGRIPVTQQLIDFVLDPRDPSYEAAARRRGGRPVRRWYDRPAVAAGCVAIGFVLAVAWVHTHRGAPEAAKVHDSLVQRVRTALATDRALAAAQAQLATQLDRARAAALSPSSTVLRNLTSSQLAAGELAATGPGLEVRLSDPAPAPVQTDIPGRGSPTPANGGHILFDHDLRSVVNELWVDGAEAIAVNGVRLTPTSAVRFAGGAVLVDLQAISSPYVIDAIGNPDALDTRFASSDVASRYQTLAGARGIGFSFTVQSRISLAAGTLPTLRYAHVAGGPR